MRDVRRARSVHIETGHSKIQNERLAFSVDPNVGGLDVFVHHADRVRGNAANRRACKSADRSTCEPTLWTEVPLPDRHPDGGVNDER